MEVFQKPVLVLYIMNLSAIYLYNSTFLCINFLNCLYDSRYIYSITMFNRENFATVAIAVVVVTTLASIVSTSGVNSVIAQNMTDMSTTNMTGTTATNDTSANESGSISGLRWSG